MTEQQNKDEWVGDAVLALATKLYLFDTYPEYNKNKFHHVFPVLISNNVIGQIAVRENIVKLSDCHKAMARSFEINLTCLFKIHGIDFIVNYLKNLFERHVDVRYMLDNWHPKRSGLLKWKKIQEGD